MKILAFGAALAITLSVAGAAFAAPLSVHLITAEGCAQYAKTESEAFVLGVASHVALDLVVKEVVWDWRSASEWEKKRGYIIAEGFMLLLILSREREARENMALWGAFLPDLIDGIYSLLYPEKWGSGDLLFFWHRSW